MLQFLAKESDVGSTLLKYLQLKKDFHANTARQIDQQIEHFQALLNAPSVASPIFGCALDDHLRKQGHGVCIALPIRTCVCRLIQLDAVREEGLFRVASSTLKIKRLAALFDTGEATDAVIKDVTDPHVFSGALKLYLRELPVPLLGQNYDRWISECGGCSNEEKKRDNMDRILSGLPQNSRHNLHYVLKFLQLVASHSAVNKMTSANLSIVLAPNLLWNPVDSDQHDLSQTNIVNDIVETLIEQVDFFFRGFGSGSIDYFKEVTLEKPKNWGKAGSSDDGERTPTPSRTPIPKPRQSKGLPRGPPPPLAPRPVDRTSMQNHLGSGSGSTTTHL